MLAKSRRKEKDKCGKGEGVIHGEGLDRDK